MKVLFINEVCGHTSTGKICADLAEECIKKGDEVTIAYGRDDEVPEKYRRIAHRIGNDWDVKKHAIYTRLCDKHGLGSKGATKKFIKWMETYNPDTIWIHNLHGYYINYEMLFDWIKKNPQKRILWTLHDCWSFTGHCTYFSYVQCEKWKSHCSRCPQKKSYPASVLFDCSKSNYERKRNAFTGVKNMEIIVPSRWLKGLVEQSYLSCYPVVVRYNAIDLDVFRPTASSFRQKYGIIDKKIILAVSNAWKEPRKGYKDLLELRTMLDQRYVMVIVGLTDKMIKALPNGIIGIKKTKDASELAEIYTAADVLLNPTYEDNYPTVNLEARACGTPVITYRTGGSPESVPEENVIEVGDIKAMANRVKQIVQM